MKGAVLHSTILVSSLWRVLPITLSSQTDMPSLTTVTLDRCAFSKKKTVHTKSSSSFSPSFLDITPALQQYLSFPVSFTHHSQASFTPLTLSSFLPYSISHRRESQNTCQPTNTQRIPLLHTTILKVQHTNRAEEILPIQQDRPVIAQLIRLDLGANRHKLPFLKNRVDGKRLRSTHRSHIGGGIVLHTHRDCVFKGDRGLHVIAKEHSPPDWILPLPAPPWHCPAQQSHPSWEEGLCRRKCQGRWFVISSAGGSCLQLTLQWSTDCKWIAAGYRWRTPGTDCPWSASSDSQGSWFCGRHSTCIPNSLCRHPISLLPLSLELYCTDSPLSARRRAHWTRTMNASSCWVARDSRVEYSIQTSAWSIGRTKTM